MKSTFKSFITHTDQQIDAAWRSESTLLIFDTSVLLNLYGFEEQTRKDFFSTTAKLTGKIWIPFHVGLEYNLQRLNIINREKKLFKEISSVTDGICEKLESELNALKLRAKFPKIHEHSSKLINSIKDGILEFQTEVGLWDKKQPHVRTEDKILNNIDKMTDGRIGPPPPNQEWLNDVYKKGQKRYEDLIPPGYKDGAKDKQSTLHPTFGYDGLSYQRKYGDLIIWQQILSEVETRSIQNVFLVTDDAKEDWWSIIQAEGKKFIGPHPALSKEICSIASVDFFHMYSTSDFLAIASKITHVPVSKSSISDANIEQKRSNKDIEKHPAWIQNRALYKEMLNEAKMERARHAWMRANSPQIPNYPSELLDSLISPVKYDPAALTAVAIEQLKMDFAGRAAMHDFLKENPTPMHLAAQAESVARAQALLRSIKFDGYWGAHKSDDDDDDDAETVD